MLSIKSLFFVLSLSCAFKAYSAQLKSAHETIRNLGMGGVRVANKHNAIASAWNPAYLGYNSGLNMTLFDGGAGLNGIQAYDSFSGVDWSAGVSSFNGIYGKPLWIGASGILGAAVGNVGGFYSRYYDLSVLLKDPVLPTMDVTYFEDDYYVIGAGFEISKGLTAGINFKRVTRVGGAQTISTAELLDPAFTSNLQNNLVGRFTDGGEGYGFDIGVAYRVETLLNPTISLSWQDIGYTSFRPNNPNIPIDPLRDNLILSATFEQSLALIGIAGGLEYRHIRNDDEQPGKKIHAGLELNFLFLDLRAGLYQGYPSYGLGMSFWVFQLDAVSYSNEFGVFPGQTPQERIQLALNMNLSFDPDFNFISPDGEKRSLKRRR